MIFRQLIDYETYTYTYLIGDEISLEAIIIDPVKENIIRDLSLIKELGLTLKYSLETHIHADHITSADLLRKETKCETAASENADIECANIKLKDGDVLFFGKYILKAISTPGHTNTCMSFLVENMIFTGDALFVRGNGRTDFQSGSSRVLYESITKKLFTLSNDTIVYPGHDYKGMTVSTIGEEKKYNPRIREGISIDEFVAIMSNLNLAQPKKIQEAVPANLKCGKE